MDTTMDTTHASTHFTWDELACRCGCGIRNICPRAIRKLQRLRDIARSPIMISSAARCPQHNARIGGAVQSYHIATPDRPSCAFDVLSAVHDPQRLAGMAEQAGFRGIGTYHNWVHVDDRSYDARW